MITGLYFSKIFFCNSIGLYVDATLNDLSWDIDGQLFVHCGYDHWCYR